MRVFYKSWMLAFPLLLAGCSLQPKYKRPDVSLPAVYRNERPQDAQAQALGDSKWWEVFQDQELQGLIRTALQQNYDVRMAATRIEQARAQLGITRANQFPTVSGGAAATVLRSPKNKLQPDYQINAEELTLSASWQLDFWGQYRSATESARAQLLATEWGRRSVVSSLVANVAAGYFQLRELDLELEISRRTLASRQESLKLLTTKEKGGSISMLDVRQGEQLVYTASAQIPDIERRIQQEENFLSLLLGKYPGPLPRGKILTEQVHAPQIPAGIPSAILQRRPDVAQAEQRLIALNAQIGVARAAYFPQIALTAGGGTQSGALSGLFSGPSILWNFAAGLAQPIFTAGRIRSNVKLAEAQQQEAILAYQQTVQSAFRDVSDALVAYQKAQEVRAQLQFLSDSASDAAHLSSLRYNGGATSYLEVLTSETNLYTAELSLAQARLYELQAMVQLYNALGGGWQEQ
ncbi:MAG: efflux transporter outer membrane subunit [Acidobacteria bacterium]|nr:efflux transporter outer membrane subunit [Acidobacteriota bacterium]